MMQTMISKNLPQIKGTALYLEAGVDLALGSNANQVAFFHHGSQCSDQVIQARENMAQQAFPNSFFARQGQSIQLGH